MYPVYQSVCMCIYYNEKINKYKTITLMLMYRPIVLTSYTMGFYEIPVDIRAIFWYFFCIPRAFRRVEDRKNTKKLREYHRYFLKTHGITVLSYNYNHNVFYRPLTGVKRAFLKCMYVLCSSSMMNANVNKSERHNRARKSRTTLQNKVRLKVLPEQLTLFVNTSVTFKKCKIQ